MSDNKLSWDADNSNYIFEQIKERNDVLFRLESVDSTKQTEPLLYKLSELHSILESLYPFWDVMKIIDKAKDSQLGIFAKPGLVELTSNSNKNQDFQFNAEDLIKPDICIYFRKTNTFWSAIYESGHESNIHYPSSEEKCDYFEYLIQNQLKVANFTLKSYKDWIVYRSKYCDSKWEFEQPPIVNDLEPLVIGPDNSIQDSNSILSKYNCLCELSPFFKDISIIDFKKEIKSQELYKNPEQDLPKLYIKKDTVEVHWHDGIVKNLENYSYVGDNKTKIEQSLTLKSNSEGQQLNLSEYILNIKPQKDLIEKNKVFYEVVFDMNSESRKGVEHDLIELFENPEPIYYQLSKIGKMFFANEPDKPLKDFLLQLYLGQSSIKLKRVDSGWSTEITSPITQIVLKDMALKLEEEKTKLKKDKKELEAQVREYNKKEKSIGLLKKALSLSNESDIDAVLDSVKKTVQDITDVQNKCKNIEDTLCTIDEDVDKAKEKLNIINDIMSSILGNDKVRELDNLRLKTLTSSYKESLFIIKKLMELKTSQYPSISEFTHTFGDVTEGLKKIIAAEEERLQNLNIKQIVSEEIKRVLSDPAKRRNMAFSIEQVNNELAPYKLEIYKPEENQPADPNKQKFVGYDSGGLRGLISKVVCWGLIELQDDNSDGNIIYRPEVNIFQ